MKQHLSVFSVAAQCRYFGVSRSGFYAWLKRQPSIRQQQRPLLDQQVKQIFEQYRQRYGAKRIQRVLQAQHHRYNIKTIAASLRRQGLVAKAARRFKATTYSKHKLPVFENHLNQDFSGDQPNQRWVGDITYLATDEGWVYLAVALDLYSRRVIDWSMDKRMTAELVCNALHMAIRQRQRPPNVIVHSELSDWSRHYIRAEELQAAQLSDKMPTRKKPIFKPDYW